MLLLYSHLHSTIFILKLNPPVNFPTIPKIFTFYYIYIKTMPSSEELKAFKEIYILLYLY